MVVLVTEIGLCPSVQRVSRALCRQGFVCSVSVFCWAASSCDSNINVDGEAEEGAPAIALAGFDELDASRATEYADAPRCVGEWDLISDDAGGPT